MDDIAEFFAEQDRRMNIPDEDVDEYIQTRLATTQRNRSTAGRVGGLLEDIGVARANPQRQRFLVPQKCREETADSENESNSAYFARSSGPSSITPTTARHAKRRKTTGEYSTLKPTDCFLPAGVSESIGPDPDNSRKAVRKGGASAKRSSEFPSPNPVGTRVFRQAHLGTSGRNGVCSSTGLAPVCDQQPIMPFAQMVQTTNQAVSVTEEVSGLSTRAKTPGSKMGIQTLEGREFDAPPLSTVDNPSIMEPVAFPPVSSHRSVVVLDSTTLDGHGKGSTGFLEHFPYLSFATGITKVSLTENIQTDIAGPSSSGIISDSHEDSYVREDLVPRTPAGFNTAVPPDSSSITSPRDTLSGQSRHGNRTSHILSTSTQPSSSILFIPEDLKAPKTLNRDKRSRKATRKGSNSKQLKDKSKLITPVEYAQKLQSCIDLRVKTNYLKGKHIFYVGGDMMYASTTTKGRMEYIVNHGGTLVPRYNATIVTHIVTDASIRHTLQALSLKSLCDIPNHIPTVTWSWIVSGYRRASKRKSILLPDTDAGAEGKVEGSDYDDDDLFDSEFMHAAFPQRIDAGRSWMNIHRGERGGKAAHGLASGAEGAHHDSGDSSHISAFSQESKSTQIERRAAPLTVLPPPPLNLKSIYDGKDEGQATLPGENATKNDDPLTEYYAQAKADHEAQWNRYAPDSDDEDNDFDYQRRPVPRRGFACDLKGHKPTVCVNQHIVDKLEELRELHKAKSSEDDRWRAYSYGKCIPALRNYPKPIRSFSEARSIHSVGEKTALKIMEIINTGDLKRIKYETTEEVAATRVFQGIYGVGRHTAFSWFASGLRSLDDVRARKGGLKLSTAQEIGLKFYDDINSRMPREEARRIFETIKPLALAIDGKLFIEIMGSYRRGKADCGDIDILITRPTTDGKTHQGVLRTLLEQLHATGIITEDLAVPDDFSDLELIYRGVCKLPEPDAKRRRIDFLCVPWMSRGAALLYYTGDEIFNRAMRYKANRHGFSLNQRGLYAGVLRDPHDRQKKVCAGHLVASETEEEIFKILGVPWQEPYERVRE